jgi:hypothetical protein
VGVSSLSTLGVVDDDSVSPCIAGGGVDRSSLVRGLAVRVRFLNMIVGGRLGCPVRWFV